MTTSNNNPLYIVIEGVNGSGKSTLAEGLKEYMCSFCKSVEIFGEPDGRSIAGKRVREWLSEEVPIPPESLQEGMTWARLYSMLCLRVNHRAGIDTIVERSWLSSAIYGMMEGLSPFQICLKQKHILKDSYVIPDLMILVDIPPEEADRRIALRPTPRRRFDNLESITKACEIYKEIWTGALFAEEDMLLPGKERWLVVNGCLPVAGNVKLASSHIQQIWAGIPWLQPWGGMPTAKRRSVLSSSPKTFS